MTRIASTPPHTGQHWTSTMDRAMMMRLAATEYNRVATAFAALTPAQWRLPTDCTEWDVHALAGHLLGMAEMAASIREGARQRKAALARGGVFIDALTALQVAEHAALSPAELLARYRRVAPKAARARRRTPGFIRRRPMPVPQQVNGIDERWPIGYLIDTILTRDPWLHRVDLARSTGVPMTLTPEHDGVLVADVVTEWSARHGKPFTLVLTGPVGGRWSAGDGGEHLELDALEFCRALSGRGHATGLLATQVPF